MRLRHAIVVLCAAALGLAATLLGQVPSVKGRMGAAASSRSASGQGRLVVWLKRSADAGTKDPAASSLPRRRLLQKNKRFDPHVLVVQTGSTVEFPNQDPFFHNVFSLFDGKRFDLGLYEAGATRSVRFDREGVCYIFCNIHPEMSAVVVVVGSPWYGLTTLSGEFEISGVPPGRYRLQVWGEGCSPKALQAASREVTVGESVDLGTIPLEECRETVKVRTNKYGKSYDPQVFSGPVYLQP